MRERERGERERERVVQGADSDNSENGEHDGPEGAGPDRLLRLAAALRLKELAARADGLAARGAALALPLPPLP